MTFLLEHTDKTPRLIKFRLRNQPETNVPGQLRKKKKKGGIHSNNQYQIAGRFSTPTKPIDTDIACDTASVQSGALLFHPGQARNFTARARAERKPKHQTLF
ncbi:hypothetical protein, partial [Salmonella sp. s58408]|uniref:hypothetical protein n=1 Tax=Salmonella sp. s58408 TaxID=3159701 RepID=UPI0039819449